MPERVITITDPFNDVDDIVALYLMVKSPKIKNEGIVTTYGDSRTRAKGASKFLMMAGLEAVPIRYGVGGKGNFDVPNYMPETAYDFLTSEELGAGDENFSIKPEGEIFILERLKSNPGEISLVSLAPMTSIANVLDLGGTQHAKRIYVMAGYVGTYNHRPDAQHHNSRVPSYNVACDVEAARKVFGSGAEIYLVGKNLWEEDLFTLQDFEPLKNGTEAQRALWKMLKLRHKLNARTLEPLGIGVITYMFDPITAGVLLLPEFYDFKKVRVNITDDGTMDTEPAKEGTVFGAVDADFPRIKKNLMDLLFA